MAKKPQAPPLPLGPTSRLEFHELVIHREAGREPLIGCPRVRRYLEVDEEGVQVLEAIREAGSIRAAEALLVARGLGEYDVGEYVSILRQKEFLRAIDGVEIPTEADDARTRHPVLHGLHPERLAWLRSPILLGAIVLIIGTWFALLFADPSLLPRFEHLILTSRPAANIALTLTSLFAIAYVHELAHFFVARACGIDATIKLSHRFYMIVLQTDVTNAWTLPKRQRLAIFLAGIAFNLTAAAIAGFFLFAGTYGYWEATELQLRLLRFFIYLNVFPLSFQLFLPARTDLYHVLLVVMGERNLLGDSLSYAKFRALRAWARLRGQRGAPCGDCSAAVLPEDPFCLRCGTRQEVKDPNRYPFPARSRHWMPIAGVFFVVGMLVGYTYFFTVVSRYMVLHVVTSTAQLRGSLAAGQMWLATEGAIALALGVLQAGLASYFLLKGVYGMTLEPPLSWAQRRTIGKILPLVPPERHAPLLGFLMRAFPKNVTQFERVRTTFTLASPSPGLARTLET